MALAPLHTGSISSWLISVVVAQRYFATTQLPVLVVANKSDKEVVRQDYILQPEAFCAKHKVSI